MLRSHLCPWVILKIILFHQYVRDVLNSPTIIINLSISCNSEIRYIKIKNH